MTFCLIFLKKNLTPPKHYFIIIMLRALEDILCWAKDILIKVSALLPTQHSRPAAIPKMPLR